MPAKAAPRSIQVSRAPSPASWLLQGSPAHSKLRLTPDQLQELACQRRRPQDRYNSTGPLRQQAGSYRDLQRTANSGSPPINCRSWLASEGGPKIDTSLPGPFASKLAPTGISSAQQTQAHPRSTAGAGLPAKAASRSIQFYRTPSPASRLLQGSPAHSKLRLTPDQLQELACQRRRPQDRYKSPGPLRQQAGSYRDLQRTANSGSPPINCRSWLASEGGPKIDTSLPGPFASKPAPTGISSAQQTQAHPRSTVGAGLPAKAASRSIQVSRAPSPASWLLQGSPAHSTLRLTPDQL